MTTPTVSRVTPRLYRASGVAPAIPYANPLRAWLGAGRVEGAFNFRDWLVVEVELSTGEVGYGNAGLAPGVAYSIVRDYLGPLVQGQPAPELENIWQLMYRSTMAFGRKGVGMAAISAVDIALWDAWARHLGVPVYDLLGGKKSATIPVYASRLYASGTLEDLADEAQSYVRQGFNAVKQRFVWGPADGAAGLARNVELVRTVREAVGPDVAVFTDAYSGWDLAYAKKIARLLEPLDVGWIEEPLLPDDLSGYAELRKSTCIPIAGGEHEFTLRGCADLMLRGAVDILQADTNRVGGITQARKIAAVAETLGVAYIPHAGQQHNYHLVISQAACPMAEYFPWDAVEVGNELPGFIFDGEPLAEDGRVALTSAPGLDLKLAPRTPVAEVRA